uniref:NADH-ubiquinone oxidoreductase chain 5 n=1 Tax=Fieberiella septentrionalis TaxID=1978376 RepID=A0A890CCH2_9HEMI|nr:NADH dehydrogenase subunit 5 [Fieberiella septentrionalis]QRG29272.1 NADH dehydrogenase subunit 5 [Fieberiella septentrionalis]
MLFLNYYYICFFLMLLSSMLFLMMDFYFIYYDLIFVIEWNLFSLNSVDLIYLLYLDWISMSFSFVVTFISSMVIIYSKSYMGEYNYISFRFLLLVIMFIISMMLMILSPNLISILLGWDGLGLVSYCLVIYYSSIKSYLAGMVTCLINRLGDIGLLISISWLFSYGSWNFIFYVDLYTNFLFYLIFMSSFTSSAQIPFSCWLPAAMAAPTPVSALVHSSTLVTAGVYLLIRFFNYLNYYNEFFLYISMMTMILSSFCANFENDLKKIIALSTLSQLGLMMSCLFLGLYNFSFFHLLSHAMFKSLLFLCSGIMIYKMSDNQDVRLIGCICLSMPYTTCCFNISNMALCGLPFLSGFFSKDLMLELMVMNSMNFCFCLLFYFSLGLTACYSIRLFYYSSLYNYKHFPYVSYLDDINSMKFSIFILTFFSIIFGNMYLWMMDMDLLFVCLPFYIKLMSLIFVMLGFYLGYELNWFNFIFNIKYYLLNSSMWFMFSYSIYLYNLFYIYTLDSFKGSFWGEYFGAYGLSISLIKLSNNYQYYFLNSLKGFFLYSIIFFLILI